MNRRATALLRLSIIAVIAANYSGIIQAGVANTAHNLSTSGTGEIKATSEDRICIFCHIAHHALPTAPLWNRTSSGAVYTPYTSSTIVAAPGQPTGSSILCLSCHDGTIALGDVAAGDPIAMANNVTTMPGSTTAGGLLGQDLSDDHPISFVFSSTISSTRGELIDPSALTGAVKLDAAGQLQCTTCHEPHSDTYGKFLVMDNVGSALCETCHRKTDWSQSPHKTSTSNWNGTGENPWPGSAYNTVADNGCQNCHAPHSAGHGERLLTHLNEEDTCTVCHNGNVASDVLADFRKSSSHPLDKNSTHDPNELPLLSGAGNRHVECTDCHNPHFAAKTASDPVPGIVGVDFAVGSSIDPITDVYQLCFRCHGDSTGIPAPRRDRVFGLNDNNIRRLFESTNQSIHPVGSYGKSGNVPSLIVTDPPDSILITCTDCHGSDTGGSSAPHGSNNSSILKKPVPGICGECHDLGNLNSIFKHDDGDHNEPCMTCHDPHGVQDNARLINFDRAEITPNSNGRLEWTGSTCSLTCHGKEDHDDKGYP